MTRLAGQRPPGRRLVVRGLVAVATAFVLGGCGFTGLYNAHLPGSVAGNTFTITAYFDNVLDLVPQSAVRVDDVVVGTVVHIDLVRDAATQAYRAKVTCVVKRSVHLPANSIAILQESSLLGEKFIELAPPSGPAQGVLGEGSVLADGATTAYPDVEEVFGVLAGVLTGGGLDRLQTINLELTKALAGRESQVRDVLGQLTTFVSGLDSQKVQINRAIDGLDRLTAHLAAQQSTIAVALDQLAPGITVLADQRAQLVSLLQGLSRLGVVSSRIINASVANTQADLQLLEPILTRIAAAGTALPNSLELLLDYPFPRDSVAGIPGDYTSLYVTVNGGSVCSQLPTPSALCTLIGALPAAGPAARASGRSTGPLLNAASVTTPAGDVSPAAALLRLLLGGAR